MPTFDLVLIVTMTLVMIVVMIESTGMFLALGDMTGKKVTQPMLSAGLRTDGLGTADRRHLQHLPLHLVLARTSAWSASPASRAASSASRAA
jgi:hypothetical protein